MAPEPVHPGVTLADEIEEHDLSAAELARVLLVPPNRISQIVAGKRAITADTALRLGRYFGTGPNYWLELQAEYSLGLSKRRSGEEIATIPLRGTLTRP